MSRSRVRSLTLFGASRRTRWNAGEAQVVLERLEASGLTVNEFAASEGVDPQRLYRWRAQLHGKRPERAEFVEVVPAAVRSCIEVISASGHVVRLPEAFSEDTLRRLLAVLDERPSRC